MPQRFWSLPQAVAAIAALKDSELAYAVQPIEKTLDAYSKITRGIEKLKQKRQKLVEVGKTQVRDYRVARGSLLLNKLQGEGKAYCRILYSPGVQGHIVDTADMTTQLLWDKSTASLLLTLICTECLADAKAGRICYVVRETKEENGVRLWLKNDQWVPLPPQGHFSDYIHNHSGYISAAIADKYSLPVDLESGVFPPDRDAIDCLRKSCA